MFICNIERCISSSRHLFKYATVNLYFYAFKYSKNVTNLLGFRKMKKSAKNGLMQSVHIRALMESTSIHSESVACISETMMLLKELDFV